MPVELGVWRVDLAVHVMLTDTFSDISQMFTSLLSRGNEHALRIIKNMPELTKPHRLFIFNNEMSTTNIKVSPCCALTSI